MHMIYAQRLMYIRILNRARAMALKPMLLAVGPQFVAKGIEIGLEELDTAMGRAAAPPLERPSVIGNLVASLGGLVGGYFLTKNRSAETKQAVFTWAGHHATELVDTVKAAIIPARLVLAPMPAIRPGPGLFLPTGVTPTGVGISREPETIMVPRMTF